ncbi:hypothetical protein M8C21_008394, partial [Ambrosia artemisiifolia]
MAIMHFLLRRSNLNSIKKTLYSRPTESSSYAHNNIIPLKRNYCSKTSPKFDIKRFIMNLKSQGRKCCFGENIRVGECNTLKKLSTDINTWRIISMENVKKALQISATAGGVFSGLWFLYDHHNGLMAFAASGGRMGGSDFSSSRSSSGGYGSNSSSSSYRYPSSSSSYYLSDSSCSNYRKQIGSPAPKEVKPIRVIMICSAVVIGLYLLVKMYDDLDDTKTSVIKLQVGSLGTVRPLQKDLNRIAKVADTSNSKGLQFVLQESILALLRHSDYCISGYSSVNVKRSVEECEKQFNRLSIKERVKFDEETLVNVNNIKMKSAKSQSSDGLRNDFI